MAGDRPEGGDDLLSRLEQNFGGRVEPGPSEEVAI
jgi:hypothetical protein